MKQSVFCLGAINGWAVPLCNLDRQGASILNNLRHLCEGCDNDGFCFISFYRVCFSTHTGCCFRDCGHPHTHYADCDLSAAQVGTDSLSFYHTHTHTNTHNHSQMIFITSSSSSSCLCRLMMILLPPVPAPKIKGIDPELLKVHLLYGCVVILACLCMFLCLFLYYIY